jgi:very-short-patch-repair endonuclease
MALDPAVVVGGSGWITRAALLDRISTATLDSWLRTGRLIRLDEGVYAIPEAGQDWRVRAEAAVRTRGGIVSHGSALALWGLVPPPASLHLTVGDERSGRGTKGFTLHRSRDLSEVRRVERLPVTCVERALVDTWGRPGELSRTAVRAATITAVRDRMCSARDLRLELDRRLQLPERAAFAALVRLLAEGCRSELEIWGCLHILRGPGMPTFVLQRPVTVRGETFLLDAACEESMLAVELDGAAWHGSRRQREKDIRRDALLATVGWQTLRFGFARAHRAADDCRRDILAAHTARLRLIRGR